MTLLVSTTKILLLQTVLLDVVLSYHSNPLSLRLFKQSPQRRRHKVVVPVFLKATPENDAVSSSRDEASSLLPSSSAPQQLLQQNDDTSPSNTVTTTFMITNEMKRVLIEELGYKRMDVEKMKVEFASPIIAKRLRCPPEGMPREWYREDDNGGLYDLSKLENESKYPLKFPLLAVSLILAGKGLSDAIITSIKVQQGFPGVSMTGEVFMGLPVIGIDVFCVIVGTALGIWTWTTMKD